MPRRVEHDARGAGFHLPAQIHDQHAFAQLAHHRQVVAHEHQAGAALALACAPAARGSAPGSTRRARSPPRRRPVVVATAPWRARWPRAGTGRRTASGCGAWRNWRPVRRRRASRSTRRDAFARHPWPGRSARSGSAMHSADAHGRIEARERILENDLHGVARRCAALRPRDRCSGLPSHTIFSAASRRQSQQRPRQRRFAGAGFADDAQRLAVRDSNDTASTAVQAPRWPPASRSRRR